MSQPWVCGRLAPSPTGAQHLGNARTYLIAWLSARSQGGTVHLRIEDIDTWRNQPNAVSQLEDDLARLGLGWDGPAVVQSHRLAAHEAALQQLQAAELVYPCTCSRTDIERAASAPHREHEPPPYPGTCAKRCVADAARLDRPYAWRFRVAAGRASAAPAEPEGLAYDDGFLGPIRTTWDECGGDFVVWRSFGVPAYQLAVVVDDAAAGVTEVVRGDDLVLSTPRQLRLYQALGLPAPRFYHVPLVVGPDGRRLAKRHGDSRLQSYWAAGLDPEMILGYLAWSCGWIPRAQRISAADLIPYFRWESIPRAPWEVSTVAPGILPDGRPRSPATGAYSTGAHS